MLPLKTFPIKNDWKFRKVEDPEEEWLPVSQFPTNVHLDLLHHGIIPDPMLANNEEDVQWVGEKIWAYKTAFPSPKLLPGQKAVIQFDGLDTHASVIFNGKEVLKTENTFLPDRLDVTDFLNVLTNNDLHIIFESTYLVGKKLVEADPHHKYGCWNDLFFTADVDKSLAAAEIVARCEVEGDASEVKFEIVFQEKLVASETVEVVNGTASTIFRTQKPELWYPARYGGQPLYHLKAILLAGTSICDSRSRRFGLRRAEVVQRKLQDAPGASFFFQVNNVPMFCGGTNWIPGDTFIPRIELSRYRAWLELAIGGNQSMIRIWGGGIFEEQVFYDTCDELGILVWQDFMFACGNYPAHGEFLDLVKREATANTKRLRHHPCIVIWAGNNEDYQYRETENLDYDPEDHDLEQWLKTNFPARYIYEKILVDVTRDLVPNTYYHFGSPFGGKSTRDPTIGDIHQWNVWHGMQESYQNWDHLDGRFVSEFGMEAFPSKFTIDSYLPKGKDDAERHVQSRTVDFHNKAAGGERRLATYLVENIPYSHGPFEYYIYCTQLMQAECLATAFRLWKRQWKGHGREYCGGALAWQLNDCWPCQSWSIVDYYLQPKSAYYAIKRELADVTISMKRVIEEIPADKYTRAHIKRVHKVQLFATNLSLKGLQYTLTFRGWDIGTGERMLNEKGCIVDVLHGNCSTEICERELGDGEKAGKMGFAAYLVHPRSQSRQVLARTVNWPEPLKYVRFPRPKNLRVDLIDDGDGRKAIEIESDVPIKGFVMEMADDYEGDRIVFEDNCVDLVPREAVRIGVKGLEVGQEHRVKYRYLKAAMNH
ncbi:MAG: hypothetical protein Q9200_005542 [Gallowayella weberi]